MWRKISASGRRAAIGFKKRHEGVSSSTPLHQFLLLVFLATSSSADPLERIQTAVERECHAGRIPVIVFNIDGTIFDNRSRSLAILNDFVAEGGAATATIADSVAALKKDSMEYYVVDSFKRIGVDDLFIVEAALKFWSDRFFSNDYVNRDMPLDGAVEFINRMHDAGAMIIYLSGRGRTNMLIGTITALREAGFPVATPRSLVVLKPDPRENSLEYKRRAMNEISAIGRVVGAFDNDPRAVNAMRREWPTARIVLVKMPHEPQNTDLDENVDVIGDYQ